MVDDFAISQVAPIFAHHLSKRRGTQRQPREEKHAQRIEVIGTHRSTSAKGQQRLARACTVRRNSAKPGPVAQRRQSIADGLHVVVSITDAHDLRTTGHLVHRGRLSSAGTIGEPVTDWSAVVLAGGGVKLLLRHGAHKNTHRMYCQCFILAACLAQRRKVGACALTSLAGMGGPRLPSPMPIAQPLMTQGDALPGWTCHGCTATP